MLRFQKKFGRGSGVNRSAPPFGRLFVLPQNLLNPASSVRSMIAPRRAADPEDIDANLMISTKNGDLANFEELTTCSMHASPNGKLR